MKRILLCLFILVIVSVETIAQIEINPGTITLESEGSEQIFIDILITNNDNKDKEIFWLFEPAASYPSNWKTQVCDLRMCYDFDDLCSDPKFPNFIKAGEEMKFTLKVVNVFESLSVNGSSYGILKLYDNPDKTNEVASSSP